MQLFCYLILPDFPLHFPKCFKLFFVVLIHFLI